MPRRDSWNSELFDQKKAELKKRYGLTNKKFSKALDVIQATRERRAILGVETALSHLSDEDVVWAIEQWRRLHPIREGSEDRPGTVALDEQAIEALFQYSKEKAVVVAEIEGRLGLDKLAELKSMFSLGRDNYYSEYFEEKSASETRSIAKQKATKEVLVYLISKTNLLPCVKHASQKLGRLSLSLKLEGM